MSDETKTSKDEGAEREAVQEVQNAVASAKAQQAKVIETVAKLGQELKQATAKAEQAGASATEQVTKIRTELADGIAKMEQLATDVQRLGTATAQVEGTGVASAEYRTKFNEHFRAMSKETAPHGADLMQITATDENVTDSESAGGILVPPQYQAGIKELVTKFGRMRDVATVVPTGTDRVITNVALDEPEIEWVGERSTRSDTDTVEFGDVSVDVMEVAAKIQVSNKMLEDAGFDFGSWIVNRGGRALARGQEAAFISGNTKLRPRGVLTYDIVANSAYEWGKVGRINTGVDSEFYDSSATATGNPAGAFTAAIFALDQAYLPEASFMMNRQAAAKAWDIVDKNRRPLMVAPTEPGGLPSIYGIPVRINDHMPVPAAGSYSAMLISRDAYTIAERRGMTLIRDNITKTGFTKYALSVRVGGGITNFEALKLIQMS